MWLYLVDGIADDISGGVGGECEVEVEFGIEGMEVEEWAEFLPLCFCDPVFDSLEVFLESAGGVFGLEDEPWETFGVCGFSAEVESEDAADGELGSYSGFADASLAEDGGEVTWSDDGVSEVGFDVWEVGVHDVVGVSG